MTPPKEQQDAQAAVQYLLDSADEYGKAKATANYASNSLRRVKALAMTASEAPSAAMKEKEAYASPQYQEALENEYRSVLAYETLRAKREAQQAVLEYWRSYNANLRAAERGFSSGR